VICAACGGATMFIARYVDDLGEIVEFHETCVGAWLMKHPARTLRFQMGEPGRPVEPLDLMEALKRSIEAPIKTGVVYTGPQLVVEDEDECASPASLRILIDE
jgi:hypothetical protein